jgi:hypothetical protein
VNLPETFAEFESNQDQLQHLVPAVHNDPAGVFFKIPETIITKVINEVFEETTIKA